MSRAASATQLYRALLKELRTIPERNSRIHYTQSLRDGFTQHSDETDPERLSLIFSRAKEDVQWIMSQARRRDVRSSSPSVPRPERSRSL